jgi:glycosyltransferase involved in cell wall biosynthesis
MLPLICRINSFFMSRFLQRHIKKLELRNPLIYNYTPYAGFVLKRLRPERALYECVDEFAVNKRLVRRTVVERLERDTIGRSDAVIVTAPYLLEMKKKHSKKIFLIPNGSDVMHFREVNLGRVEPAEEIAELPKPVVGFVGALAYWIDLELIEYLANRLPHCSIAFVGPVSVDAGRLAKYRNVHFLGRKPYADIPKYMAGIDVCINPYILDEIASGCSPLKLYEYMAAGKPIVSVRMPEAELFADLVDIADTKEEFAQKIDELTAKSPDSRRSLADRMWAESTKHSWDQRFQQTCNVLAQCFETTRFRIGIKATQIVEGGGLTHLRMLLKHYPQSSDAMIVVYLSECQRSFDLPSRDDITYRYFRFPSRWRPLRIIWEQFVLRRHLKKDRIDVLFEPGNLGMISRSIPRVMLIHNIAPYSNAFIANEPFSSKVRLHALRRLTRLSVSRSRGVVHLTHYAESYVQKHLGAGHIPNRVIHMGTEEDTAAQVVDTHTLTELGVVGRLVFSCSHLYRYKNIHELLAAFKLLTEQFSEPATLVISGAPYDIAYSKELAEFIRGNRLGNRAILTGAVDYATLSTLYGSCDLFVFPSELESASLILLEALKAGAPIAAADTGLCREVLDEAAVFFDPHNPQGVCDVMLSALRDGQLRDRLRRSSAGRARFFSWAKTAAETDSFLREVMHFHPLRLDGTCDKIVSADTTFNGLEAAMSTEQLSPRPIDD